MKILLIFFFFFSELLIKISANIRKKYYFETQKICIDQMSTHL